MNAAPDTAAQPAGGATSEADGQNVEHDGRHLQHAAAAQERLRAINRVTWSGVFINVFNMLAQFAVGIFTGSLAAISDAFHSLSDLVTDAAVLLGARAAAKPPDSDHPYGHGKFETLAALFVSLAVVAAGLLLAWRALSVMVDGESHEPSPFVLVAALVCVISKEIIFRVTRTVARRVDSPALFANAWHHRSDALSSVVVALGWLVATFTDVQGDFLAAMVVGLMIAGVGAKMTFGSIADLSERAADGKTVALVHEVISSTAGVRGHHRVRTRVVGHELFVDCHILVDPNLSTTDAHDIATQVEDRIDASVSKPVNVMVHIEPDTPDHHNDSTPDPT